MSGQGKAYYYAGAGITLPHTRIRMFPLSSNYETKKQAEKHVNHFRQWYPDARVIKSIEEDIASNKANEVARQYDALPDEGRRFVDSAMRAAIKELVTGVNHE